MSNLLFNIRFGTYHWQLTRDWKTSWQHNPMQARWREKYPQNWRRFQVYCFFGKHI